MPRPKKTGDTARARQLRQKMSLPEVLLWRELRKQSDVKFRRQHPLGLYVLDFYCAAAKLCIEIDGIAHDIGTAPTRDAIRDEWLREQGIKVLRIAASEVLRSPHEVAEGILRLCAR
ncbi:endonuclease domain-containing protein [Alteriqipengyuania lutimaris]|uniref:Endonuclease domain-containing protein n=1 Tax=Alteriqipengyuania lutimaris TaxID=1538146 RepID=A0A395LNB2_9SPHN|nr:endonuclease domain-containing protein [Alteriqipengyuania lutimaris]MBB3032650.1 very-short-patch-repair endonuclease [Alteriqipengyuania lutimaris]RDS78235.1 endonuclease domain-containing protein [Alteriqipengyuania lutimaris]